MIPRGSDDHSIGAVRFGLAFLAPACAVIFAVAGGCSQVARDRFMHWFFEIPADSKETTASPTPAPPDEVAGTVAQGALAPRFRSVHAPFAQRRCDQCHSDGQRMRVREDALDSCRSCHAKYFSDSVGHAPVAQGQCVECHDMHRTREPALLKRPVFETCVECHGEPDSLSPDAHRKADARQCTACHDPHFGVSKLLKAGVSTATVR